MNQQPTKNSRGKLYQTEIDQDKVKDSDRSQGQDCYIDLDHLTVRWKSATPHWQNKRMRLF